MHTLNVQLYRRSAANEANGLFLCQQKASKRRALHIAVRVS